ncbi:MAG: hypothetical protein V4542_00625 [Pseudomonadota bacterium]
MFFIENHVKSAVAKAGGPTFTSNKLHVSNSCIHSWVRKGRVSNIEMARKLSQLSGVPLEKLRGAA